MSDQELKAFKLPCKLGDIHGAVSQKGLLALTVPNRTKSEFTARIKRLAPQAKLNWAPADETEAGRQLAAYLQGKRETLSAALDLRGVTEFTKAVLNAVKDIPFAQTLTYGQVAAVVGRPKAARAVGRAVGSNPIPIFIA